MFKMILMLTNVYKEVEEKIFNCKIIKTNFLKMYFKNDKILKFIKKKKTRVESEDIGI